MSLFRRVIDFSRAHYDKDRATYHVHATNQMIAPPSDIADDQVLEQLYLEQWSDVPAGHGFTQPGRQILHCTFGTVMGDADLGSEIRAVLREHSDTHRAILIDHFGRHLQALNSG